MELGHPIGLLVQQRDAEGDLQTQPKQHQFPRREGKLPARLHQRRPCLRRHGQQGYGAQDVALAVTLALTLTHARLVLDGASLVAGGGGGGWKCVR